MVLRWREDRRQEELITREREEQIPRPREGNQHRKKVPVDALKYLGFLTERPCLMHDEKREDNKPLAEPYSPSAQSSLRDQISSSSLPIPQPPTHQIPASFWLPEEQHTQEALQISPPLPLPHVPNQVAITQQVTVLTDYSQPTSPTPSLPVTSLADGLLPHIPNQVITAQQATDHSQSPSPISLTSLTPSLPVTPTDGLVAPISHIPEQPFITERSRWLEERRKWSEELRRKVEQQRKFEQQLNEERSKWEERRKLDEYPRPEGCELLGAFPRLPRPQIAAQAVELPGGSLTGLDAIPEKAGQGWSEEASTIEAHSTPGERRNKPTGRLYGLSEPPILTGEEPSTQEEENGCCCMVM